MDAVAWADFQEKVTFVFTLFGPFAVWFAGKFIYNRWEKKKKDIELNDAETQNKKKEAELLVLYEDMVRRASVDVRKASDEAINQSDRWQKIEADWTERLRKLDTRITDQNKDIAVLRSENAHLIENVNQLQQDKIRMGNENVRLQEEKLILVAEVASLKSRVEHLEKALQESNNSNIGE